MATPSKKKSAKKKPVKKAVAKSAVKASAKKPPAKKVAAKKAVPVKAKVKTKAKPAAKPVAKAPSKPAVKVVGKPAVKGAPAAKVVGKPAVKGAPAAKVVGRPAVKGTPGAKVVGKPAVKNAPPVTTGKLVSRLVPSTPGAIRPQPPGKATANGGKVKAVRPPAPIIPLGVLPPENQQRLKSAPAVRVIAERRPEPAPKPRKEPPPESKLSKQDLEYFEQRLQVEHARIMGEMGHLESTVLKVNPRDAAGELSGYTFNMADAGTDSMEREISFDIASKEGRLLVEVRDALKRVYAGTFGICEASGVAISRARLEALPWARYTIAEQEKLERKQRRGARVAAEAE